MAKQHRWPGVSLPEAEFIARAKALDGAASLTEAFHRYRPEKADLRSLALLKDPEYRRLYAWSRSKASRRRVLDYLGHLPEAMQPPPDSGGRLTSARAVKVMDGLVEIAELEAALPDPLTPAKASEFVGQVRYILAKTTATKAENPKPGQWRDPRDIEDRRFRPKDGGKGAD